MLPSSSASLKSGYIVLLPNSAFNLNLICSGRQGLLHLAIHAMKAHIVKNLPSGFIHPLPTFYKTCRHIIITPCVVIISSDNKQSKEAFSLTQSDSKQWQDLHGQIKIIQHYSNECITSSQPDEGLQIVMKAFKLS